MLFFEADVAGTREIQYWVLGWGAQAEVLEPAILREEVLAEARAMARLYETGLMLREDRENFLRRAGNSIFPSRGSKSFWLVRRAGLQHDAGLFYRQSRDTPDPGLPGHYG